MSSINVVKRDGSIEPLQIDKIHKVVAWACNGLEGVFTSTLETEARVMLFDGIKTAEIHKALIKAAESLISVESMEYDFVAARLLLQQLFKETTGGIAYGPIKDYITLGVAEQRLSPQMLAGFDFERLDAAIDAKRDLEFTYLGLQTLVDRYFIRKREIVGVESQIIELPQHFWMRVAMGLSLQESDRTGRAIEFYDVLSNLEFISSTPTLFNSGTNHSQMSSCYLNTVDDSIFEVMDHNGGTKGIFSTITECALLSKYAGGIGTDWTRVRPAGDIILGTNGESSGVVPYLKIFNDTAVAVNQGGKRNGAFAAYLEPWHPDFPAFLELKKNSGEERKRAHDIFPVAWIPDLLYKRKDTDGLWSFFSPAEFPELHELHGEAFERRYEELEAAGKFRSQMSARKLWRQLINALFETGAPWITNKDEMNRRNPQSHVGVIHNSNLCTEIALNTSDTETAVCNLGSVNLSRITTMERFRHVINVGMRMLDNVIDINFYPSEKAKNANFRHRPVGMGVMGYMDWLVKQGIDFESEEHMIVADELFETFSYYAIWASMELAKERGAYNTFPGSKWSKGILPIDTARDLPFGRKTQALNWALLRNQIIQYGIRNSNTMAIAPTATISNIAGTSPTIEPAYKRAYSKKNLSGSFLVIDPTLRHGRPDLSKVAFDIGMEWVVKTAAVHQRWLDQARSTNLWAKLGTTGKQLDAVYTLAHKLGVKTTYYLRVQSAEEAVPVCKILDSGCTSCE